MVALAISMRPGAGQDSFGNVKAKVQKMLDALQAGKDEEIKVGDKCRADRKKNADDAAAGNEYKKELATNEANLSNKIANLKDAIAP